MGIPAELIPVVTAPAPTGPLGEAVVEDLRGASSDLHEALSIDVGSRVPPIFASRASES